MSVKPIPFNGQMVRATLDGLKSETRKPVDPQPPANTLAICESRCFDNWRVEKPSNVQGGAGTEWYVHGRIQSPYSVGDVLWVRETHTIESSFNVDAYPPPFTDGRPTQHFEDEAWGEWWEQCHYRATDAEPELCYEDADGPCCRWKPSIHMPRWAARIFLLVTAVRCEPLQKITEVGAIAEGCSGGHDCVPGYFFATPKEHFRHNWNSIYAKRGLGFAADPWVWVTTFERTEDNE
jgi:hypothetical protein